MAWLYVLNTKKDVFEWSAVEKILDESIVSGNWLKDGSLEIWTSSSALTHWSKTGSVSLNKATLSPYYKHGATSCLMDTATGSFAQTISNNDDLKYLQGRTVTFTVQGHSNTADSLKISIYDGATTTCNVAFSNCQRLPRLK